MIRDYKSFKCEHCKKLIVSYKTEYQIYNTVFVKKNK